MPDPSASLTDSIRLAALERTGLLDSPAEEAYDRLTRLAARLLRVPTAMVTVVDGGRVFVKSGYGLDAPLAERRTLHFSESFCPDVVAMRAPVVVEDARLLRPACGGMAAADFGVVAYAGMPLTTRGGEVIGSFCVIDRVTRTWTEEELETLGDLAATLAAEVELRIDVRERALVERPLESERVREHPLEIARADGVRRRVVAGGQVLRASEERYRSLVEAASDIIYQTDAGGCFTYINPVASKVMEYPAETLLGTHFASLVREDAREAALEFYGRQMEERIPTTYYEFPTITAGGREVWIGQNVQLIRDGDQIRGCQAVARDITAQREVERIKDEFLAVVSHELRTPLTALRGSLGLLASGGLGELQPQGQRMLEVAAQNAHRLARLVDDILDLERIESGKLHLERRAAEVATLMEDAALALRDEAERVGVSLLTSPVHGRLRGDPDRILQALTNLLGNAIKFSPRGGSVWLTATLGDRAVEFRVSDQGPGIPADKREIIFDRFQQVDSSDTRQKGGTGLGLAITRGIVEQHGGRIWVESERGRGSSFRFTVPLDADDPARPA